MRALLFAGTLVAGAFLLQAAAVAQKAPIYRYCLQEGGIIGNGGTLCRYETLAQCWASKNSSSDFCYPNPAYPGSRR